MGDSRTESRTMKVPCTGEPPNCTRWIVGKIYYDATSMQCFSFKIRTCENPSSGKRYNETTHSLTNCPIHQTVCSNISLRHISSMQCGTLATRSCLTPLGVQFVETNYSAGHCGSSAHTMLPSILIKPSPTAHHVFTNLDKSSPIGTNINTKNNVLRTNIITVIPASKSHTTQVFTNKMEGNASETGR